MKEFTYEEQKEIAKKFKCWLGIYTDEVISKVLERFNEIVENEFAMKLIDELYFRTLAEKEDEIDSFETLLFTDIKVTVHNHCITHAKSYRDVLYDMYIK